MKRSKNSIRKDQRKEYYAAMNALSCDAMNGEAQQRLAEIKEQFFAQVDHSLNAMDSEALERDFVREVRLSLSEGGWVTVYRRNGTAIQVKSSLWDYMASREQNDKQAALAAEYLAKRAIGSTPKPHVLQSVGMR